MRAAAVQAVPVAAAEPEPLEADGLGERREGPRAGVGDGELGLVRAERGDPPLAIEMMGEGGRASLLAGVADRGLVAAAVEQRRGEVMLGAAMITTSSAIGSQGRS
ncbi:MAG: hypothetical protein H6711_21225 [Myxococcales bacterium]|nr:hypothetical protein [Myxococcales bacterium]